MMALLQIAAGLVLLYLVLRWDVFSDYQKWLKNQNVKHGSEWRLRVLLTLPTIILFTVAHPAERGYSLGTLWALLNSACVIGFLWWLIFDGWYNTKRRNYLYKNGSPVNYFSKFTWWYSGSYDAYSNSFLDDLQYWIGPTFSKIVKLVGVGVSVVVYVVSFLK